MAAAVLLAAFVYPYQLYAESEEEARVETARFELASAVTLTRSQLGRMEGAAAIPSLTKAIHSFEIAVFRDAPELAEPWMLLGDAYLQAGQIQAADNAYEQSIHITRVNQGLFAPEQLETVFRQADLLEVIGDLDGATGREEYALVLQRKKHGASLELLPGLYRLASWYLKIDQPINARKAYQEAVRVLSGEEEAHTNSLVDAYIGLAESYRMERFPPEGFYQIDETDFMWQGGNPQVGRWDLSQGMFFGPANRALLRAEELLRSSVDESEEAKAKLSEVMISLGDLNMLFEKWGTAQDWYESVFALWEAPPGHEDPSDSQGAQDRLKDWFGVPVPLHLPLPSEVGRVADYPPDRLALGSVTLAFSLSSHGKVGGIDTVEMVPPRVRDLRFRRALRESRYRPQIENGKPVSSERVVYRHEFVYVVEEEDQEQPETNAPDGSA